MSSTIINIIEKISVYEIINNVIPGSIYIVMIEYLTCFRILTGKLFFDVVLLYFAGLVISRIGSLFLEPLLRWKYKKGKAFLVFAPYEDYLKAEMLDKDGRVRYLSMVNNMFLCLTATVLCILLTVLYNFLQPKIYLLGINSNLFTVIGCILLVLLFAFSYKKQTEYVKKRVEFVLAENKKQEITK
jgi:hypothetical protein